MIYAVEQTFSNEVMYSCVDLVCMPNIFFFLWPHPKLLPQESADHCSLTKDKITCSNIIIYYYYLHIK